MRLLRFCSLLFIATMMAACGPALRFPPADGIHIVQRGETLYSIATAYDMDWRDLARRNGLQAPYTIYPGQRLRLYGTVSAKGTGSGSKKSNSPPRKKKDVEAPPVASSIRWRWPTQGRVVSTFKAGYATRKGIDIAGSLGQPVRAAAAGEVVYSGSGLKGYGKLIIIKHDARHLSAYAYNQDLLVNEGDKVQPGQLIARMGQQAKGKPMLHFEIRVDGRPVDPLRYLPSKGR